MFGNFNGLGMNLGNLSRLSHAKTRSISPENVNGEKGKGGMAIPAEGVGAARELGQTWKVSPCVGIKPGDTHTMAQIEGPGAIQSIWLTGGLSRDFILRIYWDNQAQPSVECPVTDFFAFGWNKNIDGTTGKFPVMTSVPVMVAPNRGMSCFWEMPFRKSCRITMENIGPEERSLFYQVNYTLTDVPEDAAYFHAQFRRSNPLPYMQDHVILDGVTGAGQYVGTALCAGLNGANNWWGEGEIKFFMDGDSQFPTICGTGTEDYFLGAYNWDVNGKYTTYSGPFAGMHQVVQPDGLYGSQQRFSMYRWHIMDPIRFESDLRVTIQDLGWRDGGRYLPRQDDIATVAYWYQTLPTAPFPVLPDRNGLEII